MYRLHTTSASICSPGAAGSDSCPSGSLSGGEDLSRCLLRLSALCVKSDSIENLLHPWQSGDILPEIITPNKHCAAVVPVPISRALPSRGGASKMHAWYRSY